MLASYRKGREADDIFRRYARLGLDRRNIAPFEAYDCMRGVCRTEEEATALLAVYDTMRLLTVSGKRDCARAVRAVYFYGAGRRPRRNDVAYRVRRLAFEEHCDERTIYRRLDYAKRLYWMILKNEA